MIRKPKLGQHFLRSGQVLKTILEEAHLNKEDTVLEVGPGKGVLTRALIEHAGHVVAIEKDTNLVDHLREIFKEDILRKKLILVNADVRDVDLSAYNITNGTFKLVANIPYYITGELLRLFLGGNVKPSQAVLLVQKEVAERIARSKKESILSLSVKAYGTPRYAKTVSKKAFNPPPKVDSAILAVNDISSKQMDSVDENLFFTIIKQGFSKKRKFLKGNLKNITSPDILIQAFETLGIPEKIRAEDVPLATWLALSHTLSRKKS